jgi:hypothetical protein
MFGCVIGQVTSLTPSLDVLLIRAQRRALAQVRDGQDDDDAARLFVLADARVEFGGERAGLAVRIAPPDYSTSKSHPLTLSRRRRRAVRVAVSGRLVVFFSGAGAGAA